MKIKEITMAMSMTTATTDNMVMTTVTAIMDSMVMATTVTNMGMERSPERPMQNIASMSYSSEIDRMLRAFGPVEVVTAEVPGFPKGDWFVIQTSPTPDKENIVEVTADIINDREIDVINGKLFHSENCGTDKHKMKKKTLDVLGNIPNETFTVAVYLGSLDKPIAIALDPVITYDEFPEHPHLNTCDFNGSRLSKPCSLCYIYDSHELGDETCIKLYNSFKLISVWLYRHQLWLETKRVYGEGTWIGPHAGQLPSPAYFFNLDPQGICHCGSGKKYIGCCMAYDYSVHAGIDIHKARKYVADNQNMLSDRYRNIIKFPQNKLIKELKDNLLR